MSRAVDVKHLGRERVICAYEIDGLVVDPGPATCVDTLLEAVGEVRGLLLTHIHLDHAGATGVLVRRFPDIPVYVHERGAPHLVDPSKLLASATRLYGEEGMARLWGEVAPVPEANVRPLAGGEVIEGAFRVAYTPGHASHHVAYLHEPTGRAYVGDVAGVRVPPAEFVVPPTPPPDIDLELWDASLDIVAGWRPEALCLTHFGAFTDVERHLAEVRERLRTWGQFARETDAQGFLARVRSDLAAAADEATVESFFQAAPPDHLFAGLDRYWRKRAEREAA
jgi:glyoxylase-like metal-dependent hydrolase (beta-lactamase superfamily II)